MGSPTLGGGSAHSSRSSSPGAGSSSLPALNLLAADDSQASRLGAGSGPPSPLGIGEDDDLDEVDEAAALESFLAGGDEMDVA